MRGLGWLLLGSAAAALACGSPAGDPAPAPPAKASAEQLQANMAAECEAVRAAMPELDAKIAAGDNLGAAMLATRVTDRFGPDLDLDPRPPEVVEVGNPLGLRLMYLQAWVGVGSAEAAIAGNRPEEVEKGLKDAEEALSLLTGDFNKTPAVQKVRQDLARLQKEAGPKLEQVRQGDVVQQRFCQVLEEHAKLYDAAPNDLKRSAVRAARAKALRAAVPNGRAIRWVGTIKTLTTTGQGNAVLELDLPCASFGMGTWNNELSDIGYGTLIPIGSPSFESLSNMAPGTEIRLDGTLIPDPDRLDGWGEVSMTEKGSMSGGFFLLRLDGR